MKGVIRSSGARPDGMCISCRKEPAIEPLVMGRHTRLYCKPQHGKAAQKIRNGKKPGTLHDKAGHCLYCGIPINPAPPPVLKLCGDPSCRKKAQFRGFHYFQRRVKWPHELSWLGPKLGLDGDDPRLPALALRLAEAGKMIVLLRVDETVSQVGRPKEEKHGKKANSSV